MRQILVHENGNLRNIWDSVELQKSSDIGITVPQLSSCGWREGHERTSN
jgi:hypothetical protein